MEPLILTLVLDDESQQRFDRLREAHFPPERNHIAAHVTLFHALPAEREQDVRRALSVVAQQPPFPVRVAGLRFLGHGVAYALESPELDRLRAGLAREWHADLTRQDRQPHRPHVTVQNKVPAEQAHALLADLSAGFAPYDVLGTGLALWRYRGGPWEAVERFDFSEAERLDRA